jgi:cation transport ATPase
MDLRPCEPRKAQPVSEEAKMASHAMRTGTARANAVVTMGLRIVGAGLLLAMAWIHWYLWAYSQYDSVPVIGPLFLINAIVGALLAIAVLAAPSRMLGITATLASLFTLGTLAALLVSIFWGLFGLQESLQGPLVPTTLTVEPLGVIVLAVLAVVATRSAGMWNWLPNRGE